MTAFNYDIVSHNKCEGRKPYLNCLAVCTSDLVGEAYGARTVTPRVVLIYGHRLVVA
jgi:hypothetical protein